MKRRRLWTVLTLFGCCLLLAGWTAFLVRAGLDRADRLSSVLGAVLTAVFGVAGIWLALRSRPSPDETPSAPGPVQINKASGQGRVYGVQGGNLTVGDPAPPDDR